MTAGTGGGRGRPGRGRGCAGAPRVMARPRRAVGPRLAGRAGPSAPPDRAGPSAPAGRAGPCAPAGRARSSAPAGRERGSAALEYLGVLPILLLVALAGIQLGLVAYTASQAGTAARAAARAAAKYQAGVSGQQAGQDAVSDWLQASISVDQGGDAVTATADVQIPSLIPGLDPGSVERSATMPMEREVPAGQAGPSSRAGQEVIIP